MSLLASRGAARAPALRPAAGERLSATRQPRAAHTRCFASKDTTPEPVHVEEGLTRRNLLGAVASLAISSQIQNTLPGSALAAESDHVPSLYSDGPDQFSIAIPADWTAGEGQLDAASGYSGASGARRALAWVIPGQERDTNVTVVITNIGADFTSLGSFGSPYAFASNLVGSMDQSYMLRAPSWAQPKDLSTVQIAKLVDAEAKDNSYMVEYTVKNQSEGHKHLLSRVTLGYNGVYNRLYTVTAQCQQDQWDALAPTLQQIVSSFKPPQLSVFNRV